MNAPEGWYYDAPDPSVGIFTGGWVHDPCPMGDGVEEIETKEEMVNTTRNPETGEVKIEWKLTCTCGATTTVYDYDYDPPEEAFKDWWEVST